jgi:hypothetical protein
MEAFIQRETTQLNNLQKNFTPNQVKQYSEEVEYIRYLLGLLAKQKAKPQTQKTKDDEDKTKDAVSKAVTKLINHFSLKKATDITHDELTPDEILDAKLTKISTKNYKLRGMDSDNYLAQDGISPDWSLDESLSSDKHIVATNSKTGKAVVAFRGTDRKNIDDLDADARIIMGKEGSHEHFTSARKVMRDAIAKYGKENVRTAGYSLGGNKSWLMGQEFGVDSRSYNPFMGKTTISRPDFNTGNEHTILRTQDDLPSAQAQQLDGKSGTEVKVLATRGGKSAGLNPFKAHADTNFTSNEGRSSLREQGALGEKMSNLHNHAIKHGEFETLNDMIKANAKPITTTKPIAVGVPLVEGAPPPPPLDGMWSVATLEPLPPPAAPMTQAERDYEALLFTDNLDYKALRMAAPHLPKQTVPKNLLTDLDGVATHNKTTGEYNISRETTRLERQFGLDKPAVTSDPNISQETARLERQFGLDKPAFTPDPASTTPQLDTQLNDIENFARSLSPPKVRAKNARTIAAKTKAKLAGLRNKTNPPLERPNSKSRGLNRITRDLENQLGGDAPQAVENVALGGSQQSGQSFTDWAASNGVKSSNSKKLLWEKSGGKLNPDERVGYDPSEAATFNDESDVNNFVNDDQAGRNTTLDEHAIANKNMQNELNNIDNAGIRAGGKSFVSEIARGLHPTNLGVGFIAGGGAEYVMKHYIDPHIKQPEALRTAETGALAGLGTSAILGTAALPEIAAGAAGYFTQKYATEGIYKGLRALGAGKEVSTGVADVGGGASAGFVAGGLGSALAAGTAEGAEIGAAAGGGVFSLETAAIGAGVGALMGLGGYAIGRIFGN